MSYRRNTNANTKANTKAKLSRWELLDSDNESVEQQPIATATATATATSIPLILTAMNANNIPWGDLLVPHTDFTYVERTQTPSPQPQPVARPQPQPQPQPRPQSQSNVASTQKLQAWIDENGWNEFETPETLQAWLTLRNWTLEQIPTLEEASRYIQIHTEKWFGIAERAEADMWSQPFAQALELYTSDHYNTKAMSDADYDEFMTWILDQGWDVEEPVDRAHVCAEPGTHPSRPWDRFAAVAAAATPIPEKPRHHHRKDHSFPVARFCREGHECAKADCRYVHGNTIAKLNRPCQFKSTCGCLDPTGIKRSQCLYIHPGETWVAGMVVVRPGIQPGTQPVPVPLGEV